MANLYRLGTGDAEHVNPQATRNQFLGVRGRLMNPPPLRLQIEGGRLAFSVRIGMGTVAPACYRHHHRGAGSAGATAFRRADHCSGQHYGGVGHLLSFH